MACNHSNAPNNNPSYHQSNQGLGSWVRKYRGLIVGAVVLAATVALALSQHWIALITLLPLLYLLPCMLMMFMCMKGMHHGDNAGAVKVKLIDQHK
jgi:Flp pilus assembly protein TadB